MGELFTLGNLGDLAVLIFLQAVLGFDNLLYISIESARAPKESQKSVRRWGIGIALVLRVILLYLVLHLIEAFQEPFGSVHMEGILEGDFTVATIIFLVGGAFLMYTAVKEIHHLLALDALEDEVEAESKKTKHTATKAITMIVFMNLIFSFDSILSAIAITHVTLVLEAAVVISGLGMILLADRVAAFLEKNKKYEILGLFILLIVAVVLLGEGGHSAHLKLFGFAVEAMSKATFYFSVAVLVIVDVLQSGYQKKLAKQRARELQTTAVAPSNEESE